MEQPVEIYSSSNEEGLLKSIGPFKLNSADMSIHGVKLPNVKTVTVILKFGKNKIYGQPTLGKQIKSKVKVIESGQ